MTMRLKKQKSGLRNEQLEHLLRGYVMLDGGKESFATAEERREVWFSHRDEIMALQGQPTRGDVWGRTYFDLFTRPDGWWSFEAPEPRRLIKGDPDPDEDHVCEWESEKAYLIRLDLLTDLERQSLHGG